MSKVILTYGTFDLFHIGHVNLLKRAKALGDRLVVGVSTDEFNATKGKKTIISFKDRIEIVQSLKYVDEAFPEANWEQKVSDIKAYNVNTFVMGHDWLGKFDFLRDYCSVEYLPRTENISSTNLKMLLSALGQTQIEQLKKAMDVISFALQQFD